LNIVVQRFVLGVALILVGGIAEPAAARAQTGSSAAPPGGMEILPLSTRADRVTGGDVLIAVRPPGSSGAHGRAPVVTVNGRDASDRFRRSDGEGEYVGLLTGLALGSNEVVVSGTSWGVPDGLLTVTNYPSIGPVVSGPHQAPFVCQTEEFALPDGTTLGPPLDEHCSVATRVHHIYRSTNDGEFRPLPSDRTLPADVEMTTTLQGRRVPFVVRVETGSMNRGIYQNLVLHDPTSEPAPSPFTPPSSWNRRLIAVHGVGCPTGWYRQGGTLGVNPLSAVNVTRLGEGYAIFTNTLNHPTNSCNSFLAGETTMMGKEHFIETFGVPNFTVSIGASGGAYTGLQVADAFPGLIDGVIATSTFPDALSIAIAGMDARLLALYFEGQGADRFTDDQKVAITGYSGVRAFIDAANQAQRTDPVPGREDIEGYSPARWHASVPAEMRYHPETNPRGARPTVFDAARNVYGVDPATGFARRPFDNVGVQYGLGALNAGAITLADFLDINEGVGGFDHDSNPVRHRSSGDEGAIQRANRTSVSLSGAGGLAGIPVMDAGGYNEASAYHYQWFHFAVRERMRLANGHADNHVLWRGAVPATETWEVMMEWLAAIHEEGRDIDPTVAAVRAKPPRALDGCWIAGEEGSAPTFVPEPQTFSSAADTRCNQRFPSYSFVRQVAGGPLHGNNLKCQLKPIDPSAYAVDVGPADLDRLRRIFPNGVCDWSRSGIGQVAVVPWPSLGPAAENRVE
jgi:hypothetical protein